MNNMDRVYSKDTIDAKLDSLKLLVESVHEVAVQTRDQAMKTNGRVNKLEKWQNRIIGGGGIVVLFGGTIIGLSLYIYNIQIGQVNTKIDTHIIQTVK